MQIPHQSAHFKNTHTSNDLARLGELLNGALKQSGITQNKKSLQLLNLACGRADETATLTDVFGKHADDIYHTGVDIRASELLTATERWKNFDSKSHTEFLLQDASKLSDSTALSSDFDIAFMRHQNFVNGDVKWSKIYDEALHRLDEEGILVITSYFDHEHQLALNAIAGLGAQLIHTERNTHSRQLDDAPNKSVDRHVAIFRK